MELKRCYAHTRETLELEIEMDAYFLRSKVCTYNTVASMIGIKTSSIMLIIRQVSRAIYVRYEGAVQLPRLNADLAHIMQGYKKYSEYRIALGILRTAMRYMNRAHTASMSSIFAKIDSPE